MSPCSDVLDPASEHQLSLFNFVDTSFPVQVMRRKHIKVYCTKACIEAQTEYSSVITAYVSLTMHLFLRSDKADWHVVRLHASCLQAERMMLIATGRVIVLAFSL